jgi:hypothetical protein
MNETKAGERKRTVTVVVGPLTVRLMERLNARMTELVGCEDQGLTGLTGAALNECLSSWRFVHLADGERQPWSHWD